MALPDTNDIREILAGCRRQDRASQHALYKVFYSYGMSVAIRYVESENEAITILNDALLKVFRKIRQFDANREFKPWLRRIIVNTAIDHIKKNRKFKYAVGMEEVKEVADREEILSKISYRELMGIIQSLSVGYRTVFNMYVIDGYKHEEIAKELGITVSTSKSNLARARERLRELLREQLGIKYV